MRIDSWDRLELVLELIKSGLPIDIKMDLSHVDVLRRPAPLPYDPRTESSIMIPLPFLAEVRVSLFIDETLAWLLPVQFCIDQLLTANEVVTKLTDACQFLKAWSDVHAHDARELLRTQRLQTQHPAKSLSSPRIQ